MSNQKGWTVLVFKLLFLSQNLPFYILLCTIRAKSLQTTFPNLHC